MDKPAIKKFAIWARNKLIADTKYRRAGWRDGNRCCRAAATVQ